MGAPSLPPAILPRLAQILRLLGSPVDGERLAACNALVRTLSRAGADIHALADLVEVGQERVVVQERTVYRDRPAAARYEGASQRAGRLTLTAAQRDAIVVAFRKARSELFSLTPWEQEFTGSILEQLSGVDLGLSARQHEIVTRIMVKLTGEAP